jgi:hypothetical protein
MAVTEKAISRACFQDALPLGRSTLIAPYEKPLNGQSISFLVRSGYLSGNLISGMDDGTGAGLRHHNRLTSNSDGQTLGGSPLATI